MLTNRKICVCSDNISSTSVYLRRLKVMHEGTCSNMSMTEFLRGKAGSIDTIHKQEIGSFNDNPSSALWHTTVRTREWVCRILVGRNTRDRYVSRISFPVKRKQMLTTECTMDFPEMPKLLEIPDCVCFFCMFLFGSHVSLC